MMLGSSVAVGLVGSLATTTSEVANSGAGVGLTRPLTPGRSGPVFSGALLFCFYGV